MIWIYLLLGGCLFYLFLTLVLTYMVLQFPRRPVADRPDWGSLQDTRIPTEGGGTLEVWRVEPEGLTKGIVVLAHGWGRNRGRMVSRAKLFGKMGFTTVMHSARDHGSSSSYAAMSVLRFAQDIKAVLDWVGEPVLLYGHSLGAAAALIVASQDPKQIRLLFLEACYARTREALLSLYRGHNRAFGILFGPIIVSWMELFFRGGLDRVSPLRLAPGIDIPVLIIHGEEDENFPLHHATRLRDHFPPGRAELFVAAGADHSSSSLSPLYPKVVEAFLDRYLSGHRVQTD